MCRANYGDCKWGYEQGKIELATKSLSLQVFEGSGAVKDPPD